MKKRVIALLAALVIAIGSISALAIVTGAEAPAPELSIPYCNLSFKDSVGIKYAVRSDFADTKLLIWTSPKAEYTAGTQDAEITSYYTDEIDGAAHKIFDYYELCAKQMTDVVYARAYSQVDGVDYYSEVNKYSILQYAYNKLGKTATASADTELKEMLVDMLEYGASAQKYLDDYKVDRLATADWYQVKLSAGVLEDGCTHGLYLPGDKVTLTAPSVNAEGATFTYWANSKNTKIATTATYELTVGSSNEVYTPVYVKYSIGLEFDSNGDGTCYIIGMGDCSDTELVIPPTSPNGDKVIGIDNSAFANEAITSVSFPSTIEEIARRAFNNCTALTDVYYDGTEEEWNNKVSISAGNDAIENATKHFNEPVVETFTVTFVDYDGTELKKETVESGKSATAPTDPEREGYTFTGWDKEFDNVTEDMTVTAEYEYNATDPTIIVSNATASAGDNVTVAVKIASNPGVAGAKFTIKYDMGLNLTSAESGDAFAVLDYTPPQTLTSGCPFNWDSLDAESNVDGTVLILTFEVSEDVSVGDELGVSVSYVEGSVYDKDLNDVILEIVNGMVTIK